MTARSTAPDIAFVLEAEDHARRRGAEVARKSANLPSSYWRRLIAGTLRKKPERRYVSREERAERFARVRAARAEVIARRDRQAATPIELHWSDQADRTLEYADHLREVESRLERERSAAAVREANAAALNVAAEWLRDHPTEESFLAPGVIRRRALQPEDLLLWGSKLLNARVQGHWGINTDTGARVIRYFDRSGLPLLDPSESRRNAARISRRLVPVLLRYHQAGALLYYGVASEPNVPTGTLEWGKRHLFRRVRRRIYDAFPEVIGVFACQEDPLAADLNHWNVHINLVLVVNPWSCTRLTEATAKQLSLALHGENVIPFQKPRAVDRTPDWRLSYAKVHHAWGSDQFRLAKLEGIDDESLGRTLREVIKYSAKMASKKEIDRRKGDGPGADDSALAADMDAGEHLPGPDRARLGGADRAGDDSRGRFELEARGVAPQARRDRAPAPPGIAEYHPRELIEYLQANRRFRRARTWGVLYRLDNYFDDDADKAGKIRWCGRVAVSPGGCSAEPAPLLNLISIHGDKSGRDFPGSTGRSFDAQARAGPTTGRAIA